MAEHALRGVRSVRNFGVEPGGDAEENTRRMQEAFDWASPRGAALFVDPAETPYPLRAGLRLRRNASLLGVHGPVGRGTRHASRRQPVGSVLQCEDPGAALIELESATQLRGLQFWYPRQAVRKPEDVVEYGPTVRVAQDENVFGVTLSCLTFFGEWLAFDFNSPAPHVNEQVLFEHCYGYPLSGRFIEIDRCYDIPRILHCHVNPATRCLIDGDFSREVIDAVVARETFTYRIDHTDNAQMMDLFTFGVYGGVRLGPASYGQLTNFNLDCVTVGIHKSGDGAFNRNWQIAQGSIIANAGTQLDRIHPLVVDGRGHTAISSVEAFSGDNPVVTNMRSSADYLLVEGSERLTVSLVGCRMRNYASDEPITLRNANAEVRAVACVDKHERFYDR